MRNCILLHLPSDVLLGRGIRFLDIFRKFFTLYAFKNLSYLAAYVVLLKILEVLQDYLNF